MREVRQMVTAMRQRAGEHDQDGSFPTIDFQQLHQAGLFGLLVPRRLGGREASFLDYIDVAYQLGRGNGSTGLIFNMHACVTGALASAPEELARELGAGEEFFRSRDQVLSQAAAGHLYAVAMSERGVGSRLSQMSTTYKKEDGHYHLTGQKSFVSGAGHADAYLIAARNADDGDIVSQFLVPAAHITVDPTWDTMGMRATGSHDITFDTPLDTSALVGGIEGTALIFAQIAPQWMVASYAAVYIGVARAAIETAADQAKQRDLSRNPAVRARLGRADAAVAAALATVRHAAGLIDQQDPDAAAWIWRAKLIASDTAAEVTASMMEACGASSIRRGNPLERLFRDARCGALQPATPDVCADWLGVHALGGDPYADTVAGPRW